MRDIWHDHVQENLGHAMQDEAMRYSLMGWADLPSPWASRCLVNNEGGIRAGAAFGRAPFLWPSIDAP